MIIKFYVAVFSTFLYTYLKSRKSFQMLQQNWYNEDNRYLKWMTKNRKQIFFNLDLLFLLLVMFQFIKIEVKYIEILFVILYMVLSLIYLKNLKIAQNKLTLKRTPRVKRLFISEFIIYLIPVIIVSINFNESNIVYYFLILGLMVYLNYIMVYFANIVNKPIEKIINNGFKKKAIKKLKNMSNMKVIGITGSYGKTSSKNILNDVLNIKFNALKTPKNFNTPVGLIITINNYLDKFNDLFIAEMGAFKKGEIKELCDLVSPTYGILTKIGIAHLESFGSQENIQTGKFELIESLPQDGIGILNGDDELQTSYKLKNNCKIVWIGINNKEVDVRATDIKITNQGIEFNVIFKDDKQKYPFSTKLLGEANVYNILASIALGKELGLSISQLQMGVKKVNQIEHRLEMKKMGNINIIDDAYNSNPVGSKMAVEVLGMMDGHKIIVTPGMIELGDKQFELNKKFGQYIAENKIDDVILIGENQTKPIYEGLISKKFKKENIFVLNDVKEAFPLIQKLKQKETFVLLENDLPDIFNEK